VEVSRQLHTPATLPPEESALMYVTVKRLNGSHGRYGCSGDEMNTLSYLNQRQLVWKTIKITDFFFYLRRSAFYRFIFRRPCPKPNRNSDRDMIQYKHFGTTWNILVRKPERSIPFRTHRVEDNIKIELKRNGMYMYECGQEWRHTANSGPVASYAITVIQCGDFLYKLNNCWLLSIFTIVIL
jgi:hypothetical protein